MKRYLLVILIIFNWVWAQSSDSMMQSYNLAIESLNQATTMFADDPTMAQEALVRAQLTLRPMSLDSDSPALVKALETTFERANVAILNKSFDDLAVQSSVLKGGYWRLLYESIVNSKDSNIETMLPTLLRMSTDMELGASAEETLKGSSNPLSLVANFEKLIGEKAVDYLSMFEQQDDTGAKYRYLADAYSVFLPIQDSPRAAPKTSSIFAKAFQELIDNDEEALAASVQGLNEALSGLVTVSEQFIARSELPQEENAQETVSSAAAADNSAASPEAVAIANNNNDTAMAAEAVSTETVKQERSEPVVATIESNQTASTPEAVSGQETASGAKPPAIVSSWADPAIVAKYEPLFLGFKKYAVPAGQQKRILKYYQEKGFNAPKKVVDHMFALSSKAIVAAESGNQSEAKKVLQHISDDYAVMIRPLLQVRKPEYNAQTTALFNTLLASPSLRVQDLIIVAGQLGGIQQEVDFRLPLMQRIILKTTNFWTGWVRLVLISIFGLLAFVPLYLLILAFGGGNKNWQLVGWALFLLLLPLIYEGITYISGAIAVFTGMSVLGRLSTMSIFQNSVAQILWFVLSAAAVILATIGLYGICVQFGLLGSRSKSSGKTTILEPSVTESAVQTNFDWDEEF